MLVATDGTAMHFRRGAPQVRLSGTTGEMIFNLSFTHPGWRSFQDVETAGARSDYLRARRTDKVRMLNGRCTSENSAS